MADARVRELALRVADLAPHERAAMYRVLAEIVREHDAGPTT